MAVYITGDCHDNFSRFNTKNFPEQKELTHDDYVIICGDFGGVWDNSNEEKHWLKWLSEKPFTTLFCDGNHENFDMLNNDYETIDFCGGKVHKIRDNVYHLIRGNIYTICNKTFFVFGGGASHDISDGILNPCDFVTQHSLMKAYNNLTLNGKMIRINHISWWQEELPSKEEIQFAKDNLKKVNNKVDYVITHCPPREICCKFGYMDRDILIDFFDELINNGLEFTQWWSGHLHDNYYGIVQKYNLIFEDIIKLIP